MSSRPALPDYLQPLEFYQAGVFPRAAMEAAIARREESIPHLLAAVEWTATQPEEANALSPFWMAHLFSMYLLAQFREPRAFSPILRLFRTPQADDLLGDTLTDGGPQILASVWSGDFASVQEMVQDRSLDEAARTSALEAAAVAAHFGLIPREEFSAWCGRLFTSGLEKKPIFPWSSLVMLCADLGLEEHLENIRTAYRSGLADPFVDTPEDVEARLTDAAIRAGDPSIPCQFRLVDDAIGEMEGWAAFREPEEPIWPAANPSHLLSRLSAGRPAPREPRVKETRGRVIPVEPHTPLLRATPKVGRNDRCPCGSGKKYKNCCGRPAKQ